MKEWVKKFIRDRLDVKIKIENCRINGNIIIVMLGGELEKREVISRKYRLKGNKIFIENDLTWNERKIQIKINRWAMEGRSKGVDIKIATEKVRRNGI